MKPPTVHTAHPAPASLPAAELQQAVRAVAHDYASFVEAGPPPGTHDDAKAFTAYHAACRAALAHLEQLLKLLRATGQAESEAAQEGAALFQRARAAMGLRLADAEEESDE